MGFPPLPLGDALELQKAQAGRAAMGKGMWAARHGRWESWGPHSL